MASTAHCINTAKLKCSPNKGMHNHRKCNISVFFVKTSDFHNETARQQTEWATQNLRVTGIHSDSLLFLLYQSHQQINQTSSSIKLKGTIGEQLIQVLFFLWNYFYRLLIMAFLKKSTLLLKSRKIPRLVTTVNLS